jgi:hypothetical protein
VIRFSGDSCTITGGRTDIFDSGLLQPTADGRLLLQSAERTKVLTPELKQVSSSDLADMYLLATEDNDFFIALRPEETPGKNRRRTVGRVASVPTRLAICTTSDCRPIFALEHLESLASSLLRFECGYFQGQPRANFLPYEKLLVTLPDSNDVVFVRQFDLLEELKKSGRPQLVVTSKPRLSVEPGSNYAYAITALSTAGGLKYRIESGPRGMTVSEGGQVSWQVPKAADGSVVAVLVVLTDASAKEAFHAFKIDVGRPKPAAPTVAAAAKPGPGKPPDKKAPVRPQSFLGRNISRSSLA